MAEDLQIRRDITRNLLDRIGSSLPDVQYVSWYIRGIIKIGNTEKKLLRCENESGYSLKERKPGRLFRIP